MNVREHTEEFEYQYLSPKAAKSREAQRQNPMEECAFRTKFQRDRDRILHSKSFRRLKRKLSEDVLPEVKDRTEEAIRKQQRKQWEKKHPGET